jgi:hypothetical protein
MGCVESREHCISIELALHDVTWVAGINPKSELANDLGSETRTCQAVNSGGKESSRGRADPESAEATDLNARPELGKWQEITNSLLATDSGRQKHRENIFHWLPQVKFFQTWEEARDLLGMAFIPTVLAFARLTPSRGAHL